MIHLTDEQIQEIAGPYYSKVLDVKTLRNLLRLSIKTRRYEDQDGWNYELYDEIVEKYGTAEKGVVSYMTVGNTMRINLLDIVGYSLEESEKDG